MASLGKVSTSGEVADGGAEDAAEEEAPPTSWEDSILGPQKEAEPKDADESTDEAEPAEPAARKKSSKELVPSIQALMNGPGGSLPLPSKKEGEASSKEGEEEEAADGSGSEKEEKYPGPLSLPGSQPSGPAPAASDSMPVSATSADTSFAGGLRAGGFAGAPDRSDEVTKVRERRCKLDPGLKAPPGFKCSTFFFEA